MGTRQPRGSIARCNTDIAPIINARNCLKQTLNMLHESSCNGLFLNLDECHDEEFIHDIFDLAEQVSLRVDVQ